MVRPGFHPRRTERCPDCDIELRLDLLGRPRFDRAYGYQLTAGCEGCGGSGRVKVDRPNDPMDTGRGSYGFST